MGAHGHESGKPGDEQPPDEAGAHLLDYADAMNRGDVEEAEEAIAGFMEELSKFCEEHEHDPRMDLLGRADDLADAGDWDGAEAAWREALESSETDGHAVFAYQRLMDLYTWLGRHEEALSMAREASAAAARYGMDVLRSMTAEREANCLARVGDYSAAVDRVSTALDLLDKSAMADGSRAGALTYRARWAVETGDIESAERDLTAAYGILERPTSDVFGAPNSVWANWWGVTARIRAARGDKAGAVAAWEEAVHYRKANLQRPLDPGAIIRMMIRKALADAWQCLGDARQAAGDLPGAQEAYAWAKSIRSTLNLPG